MEDIYGTSQTYSMHDGYGGYINTVPKDKQLKCWAHVLRYAHEETILSSKDSESIRVREELVRIYHIKFDHPEYSKEKLEEILQRELDQLLIVAI